MAACPWLEQTVFQPACSGGGSGDATSLRGVALGLDVGMPGDGEVLVYDAGSSQWVAAPRPGGLLNPPASPGDNGKIPVASSGSFVYTDAPTLVSVTTTSFLAIGSAPSSGGALRMTNGDQIRWGNGGGGAREVLKSTGEAVVVGDTSQTGPTTIFGGGGGSAGVSVSVGASERALLQASASDFIALGVNPALSGVGRFPSNSILKWRNAVNNADIDVITFNSSNNILLGNDGTSVLDLRALSNVRLFSAGAQSAQLGRSSGDFIRMGGTNYASVGMIRTVNNPSGGILVARNAANSADIVLLNLNAANGFLLGDGQAAHTYNSNNTGHTFQVSSVSKVTLDTTTFGWTLNTVQWGTSQTPLLRQFTNSVGTGATMTFQAQDISGSATVVGGAFVIRAGNCTATGAVTSQTGGSLTLQGGDVSGSSGTRNGGDWIARPGSGATANGSLRLRDGGANDRIVINSTGIGFFGVTPVARPAVTAAGVTAADLLTALDSLGIVQSV